MVLHRGLPHLRYLALPGNYLSACKPVCFNIYKRTNNPYLGGIVNASLITLMCVANITTILGGAAVVASNY